MKKFLIVFFLILIMFLMFLAFNNKNIEDKIYYMYLASDTNKVNLYDDNFKKAIEVNRGEKVSTNKLVIENKSKKYFKVKYNKKEYFVLDNNLVKNVLDCIQEKEVFVRTPATIYKEKNSIKIESLVKKGEQLKVIGFDKLLEDGNVNKYKISYNEVEGYVYSKYVVKKEEESKKKYSENGIQEYMDKMGDYLGGGSANNLDYFPYKKGNFDNNIMPNEVRALYINAGKLSNIDQYIEVAKKSNINAFVIDIKDNTSPAYPAESMKEYSKTNYERAINSYESFKKYVKKAKDEGFYLIGRITTFKDSYYVKDNPNSAITNNNDEPFNHNGSYWPSVYNRGVWEFNVSLAIESVLEFGFNEIQFDYVRFPDRTTRLEREGVINLHNTYNEEKAQALQNFTMYACDELHSVNAYCSIDVFGESASNYVTAYGQFWAGISNVADVISAMPYPDHFNTHEYNIEEVVWTVPYKLLDKWSKYVVSKQKIIPTPAKVRTWIQVYDTIKSPSVVYDSKKVSEQIQALYDNGLTGGYMTWNGSSNIEKYRSVKEAFKKEY